MGGAQDALQRRSQRKLGSGVWTQDVPEVGKGVVEHIIPTQDRALEGQRTGLSSGKRQRLSLLRDALQQAIVVRLAPLPRVHLQGAQRAGVVSPQCIAKPEGQHRGGQPAAHPRRQGRLDGIQIRRAALHGPGGLRLKGELSR